MTVFFRLLMLIPQFIVLNFVGIAAEVVLVIGWFGALFLGRLPTFAAQFLEGYLRWATRVYAYLILLTGTYPPFTLEDVDYPVRLAASPGKLNRLAVLFRIILVIPAYIVTVVAVYGAFTVMLFVTWLIVLVRGSMPESLHLAYAAVLRYAIRAFGYFFMLTAEYPGGMFGDQPQAFEAGAATWGTAFPAAPPAAQEPPTAPGPPAYGAPLAPSAPSAPPVPGQEPSPAAGVPAEPYGAQQPYGVPPSPSGQPFAYGAPPGPAAPPWQLVLTSGARRLVGFFIGLGIVLVVVLAVVTPVTLSNVTTTISAVDASSSAYATATAAAATWSNATTACQSSAQQLTCLTTADKTFAASLGTFAQSIRNISMPNAASAAAASKLASAASQAQQAMLQLSNATSGSQYNQIIQSSNIESLLGQIDQDYTALGKALGVS